MDCGIYVGGSPKESIAEARGAILDILNVPHVDNSTKVEAIKALRDLSVAPSGTQVNGASITSNTTNHFHDDAEDGADHEGETAHG